MPVMVNDASLVLPPKMPLTYKAPKPWLIVKDWPPTVDASKEVLMLILLSVELRVMLLAKLTAPVQLWAPLVLILADKDVGPVTVRLNKGEVAPTMPTNATLPPVAEPVVTVRVYGPLTVLPKRIGDEVVVIVVLPIKEATPLNMAPVELAAPLRVIEPLNQTGVVAEVVSDFKPVHNAPSIGK